jgi:hypothetical protein
VAEPQVPEAAVEALAKMRWERRNPGREWDRVSKPEAEAERNLARRELKVAAPTIRKEERQRVMEALLGPKALGAAWDALNAQYGRNLKAPIRAALDTLEDS